MRLITRCDDAGSSHSANIAISQVVKSGLVKNVSVMAPGPFVEEFAKMAKKMDGITFGMHFTLNAEWDRVKWKPLTTNSIGLVDQNGFFLPDPMMFQSTKPSLTDIENELSLQYDFLINLGFEIKYIDTHMLPELFVEGLNKLLQDFASIKGVILQSNYDNYIHWEELGNKENTDTLPSITVFHPSLDTEEMRMTGNNQYQGKDIALSRAKETQFLLDNSTLELFKRNKIEPISYCEAFK